MTSMRIQSLLRCVFFLAYLCWIPGKANIGAYIQQAVSAFVGLSLSSSTILITSDGNIVVGCVEQITNSVNTIIIKYSPDLSFQWKQRILCPANTGQMYFLKEDISNGDIFFGIGGDNGDVVSPSYSACFGRISKYGKNMITSIPNTGIVKISDAMIFENYIYVLGILNTDLLIIEKLNKNDLEYVGGSDYELVYSDSDYGVFLNYDGTDIINTIYANSGGKKIYYNQYLNYGDDPIIFDNLNKDVIYIAGYDLNPYLWKAKKTPNSDGFIVMMAGCLWLIDNDYTTIKAKHFINVQSDPLLGILDFDFFDINLGSTPPYKIAVNINGFLYTVDISSLTLTPFNEMPQSTPNSKIDHFAFLGSNLYATILTGTSNISERKGLAVGKFSIINNIIPCSNPNLHIKNGICENLKTSASCHKACTSGKCYILNDQYACGGACGSSFHDAFATCVCPPEYIMDLSSPTASCKSITKTINSNSCDYRCSGDCFGTLSNSECASCNTQQFAVPDAAPNKCKCMPGLTPDTNNNNLCIYTSGCADECLNGKCIAIYDKTRCVADCSSSDLLKTQEFDFYPVFSCVCSAGKTFSKTANACLYLSGCDEKCSSSCYEKNENSCYDNCQNGITPTTIPGYPHKVKCNCPTNSAWDSITKICIYSVGCDSNCGSNGCTETNKNDKCYKTCKPGITPVGSGNIVTCASSCSGGSITADDGVSCVYTTSCSDKCFNGICFVQNSDNECYKDCSQTVVKTNTATPNKVTCACPADKPWDGIEKLCLFITCDSRCSGKCIDKTSNEKCYKTCAAGMSLTNTGQANIVKCECPSGKEFSTDNHLCIYNTGCHDICGGKCFATGDQDQCFDSCSDASYTLTTTGTIHLIKCSCPTDSSWDGLMILCIYYAGCDPRCAGKCSKKSDNSKCVKNGLNDCGTGMIKTGGSSTFTCDCPLGQEFASSVSQCIYTTGCSDLCQNGKCFVQSSDNECYIGCSQSDMISTPVSTNKVACACPADKPWDGMEKLCLFITCDSRCSGKCIDKTSNEKCYKTCAAGMSLTNTGQANIVKCECSSGKEFSVDNHICIYNTGCHDICGGKCFATGDQDQCFDTCSDASYTLTTTGTIHLVKCSCPTDSSWDGLMTLCIYFAGCDPRCAGKCSKKSDNSKCVKNGINDCVTGMTKTGSGSIFTCDCSSGQTYEPDNNLCIYASGCHTLCGTSACFAQSNSDNCYESCSAQSTAPVSTGRTHEVKCNCPASSTFQVSGNLCVFSTGCDTRCDTSCTKQGEGNNAFCYNTCAIGMAKTGTGFVVTCNCGTDMEYSTDASRCIFNNNCSPQCGPKCFAISDPDQCYDTCKDSNMIPESTAVSHKVKCYCPAQFDFKTDINRCIYKSGCDTRCGGFCSVLADNTKCYSSCAAGNNKQNTAEPSIFSCDCPGDQWYSTDNLQCIYILGCDGRCGGKCFSKISQNFCYDSCQNSDIIKTASPSIQHQVECECPADAPWDATAGYCLYSSGCDIRCKDKCIVKASNTNCYGDCALGMDKSNIGSVYTCNCPSTQWFSDENKMCIFSTGCFNFCSSKCFAVADQNQCYKDCVDPDMIKTPDGVTLNKVRCECPLDEPWNGAANLCLFSSGCSKKCQSSCRVKNNDNYCFSACIGNTVTTPTSTPSIVACSCDSQQLWSDTDQVCYYSAGCDPRCSGQCLSKSDNSQCYKSCTSPPFQQISASGPIVTCNCPLGGVYEASINNCLYNTGCDTACLSLCTVAGSNNNCYIGCIDSNMNKVLKSTDIYSCTCKTGSVLDLSSKLCLYSTSCDLRCGTSQCYLQSDNTNCFGSCASGMQTSSTANSYLFICDCPPGKQWEAGYNGCVFITGCDPRCGNNKCISQGSNQQCFETCNTGMAKQDLGGHRAQCDCSSGLIWALDLNSCIFLTGCDARCGSDGCTKQSSDPAGNQACYKTCNTSPDLGISPITLSPNIIKCDCSIGRIWDATYTKCLYTTCDGRCNGKCTEQADYRKCYGCLTNDYYKSGNLPEITCDCPGGASFDTTDSICLYPNPSCNKMCKTTCTMPNSASSCYKECITAELVATPSPHNIVACSCPLGKNFEPDDILCVYDSGCAIECGPKCSEKNDNTKCYKACAPGTTITGSSPLYSCTCPADTEYHQDIKSCIFNTGCSDECNGLCTIKGDSSACYLNCRTPTLQKSEITPYVFKCSCPSTMSWSTTDRICYYTSGCDIRCLASCTQKADPTACYGGCSIVAEIDLSIIPPIPLTACKCKVGTTYEAGPDICALNTGCSPYCKVTCSVAGDQNKCVGCSDPFMDKTETSPAGIFRCDCPAGKSFDSTAKACYFSSGCDSRCGGNCGVINDNTKCVGGCGPNSIANAIGATNPFTKCDCDSDFDFMDNQCIRKNGCHWKCGSHCTVAASSLDCYDTCKKITYEKTIKTAPHIYECNCPIDSTSEDSIQECIYSAGCSNTCLDKCIEQGDNTACYLGCKSGGVIQEFRFNQIYKCTCPTGSIFDTNLNKCVYSVGCDDACLSTCVNQHDNTACVDDCANNQWQYANVYSCLCPSGSPYNKAEGICLFSSGCDYRCGLLCIAQNDQNSCYKSCRNQDMIMKTLSGNTVKCDCSLISIYDTSAKVCLFTTNCHPVCKDTCSIQNSDQNCYMQCKPNLTKNPTLNPYIFACSCPFNSEYNADLQVCIYNKDCHPLCGGKCFSLNDPNSCYQSCAKFAVQSRAKDTPGVVTSLPKLVCICPSDTEYDALTKRCIYTKNCHPFCKTGQCASQGNNNECIGDCAPDLVQDVNPLNYQLTTCTCPIDMEISPTLQICLYNKGCHPLCGKLCLSKNNNTSCYKACSNKAILEHIDQTDFVNCKCRNGSIYAAETCLHNQNCHPLCGKSLCYEENDPTQCYESCNPIATIIGKNNFSVSCSCLKDQMFIDNICSYNKSCHPLCGGLCFKQYDNTECFKGCRLNTSWSITGSKIKCYCQNGWNKRIVNASSFTELENFNGSLCAEATIDTKKASEKEKAENSTKEKQNMQLGSSSTTTIVAALSILSTGNLSLLSLLLGLGQFASLVLLIHMPVVPRKLIIFSQGLQFVSFEFFPNIVTMTMGTSDPEENKLDSNIQYHPSIGGRVFLDNVGNTLTIALCVICLYKIIVIMSKTSNGMLGVRQKFEWGFFLDLICAGSFDFLLCGIVQIMNLRMPDSAYYRASFVFATISVLACWAFNFVAFFIVFRNRSNLSDDCTENKFGVLFQEYRQHGLAKYTKFIELLVRNGGITSLLLIGDPIVQSSVYVVLNMTWFGWNLFFMPYESIFTQVSVLFNSGVIVLSGITCMKLCQNLPADTLDFWGGVIVNLFFAAAGSCLLLPIAEKVIDLYKKFYSWKVSKIAGQNKPTHFASNSIENAKLSCENSQNLQISCEANRSLGQ